MTEETKNSQYVSYPMFKGLQKPLEFMGIQGRYIEDLPIHHSQTTLKKEGDWTYFSIFVNPDSNDLYFELRKYGALIEILSPQSVRERLGKDADAVAEMYLEAREENNGK